MIIAFLYKIIAALSILINFSVDVEKDIENVKNQVEKVQDNDLL